mmetsp:Transcript_30118/g.101532  ORF Transcript_30118/g.101532 Transcript_30118/m.101532 type:complete len:81 (-) Transcript_30118:138-380(-)|eukprot:CAMPEP_0206839466 /NCGR_PEP_ID=MMETSP0975-20121206/21439_1 /ASSEMBLY_ACC=CAM_ASM_000399 /TAXON_ID=483370 /ORGANISM="non described non described, Strain CCMP2097" /LENGTH=80 /DNA_ID=CAMNT_0054381923 /DNA_START=76 /DNA_END=318 /DNA_ORIENTATION=-
MAQPAEPNALKCAEALAGAFQRLAPHGVRSVQHRTSWPPAPPQHKAPHVDDAADAARRSVVAAEKSQLATLIRTWLKVEV